MNSNDNDIISYDNTLNADDDRRISNDDIIWYGENNTKRLHKCGRSLWQILEHIAQSNTNGFGILP